MIPKSVQRFSEKIMLKQEARAGIDLGSELIKSAAQPRQS
jgi:hypothetical protein